MCTCTCVGSSGSEEKLAVCKQYGADSAVNYKTADFVEVVNAATNGKGQCNRING